MILQAAPVSIWDISIYREQPKPEYHLLESLKTGELQLWTNVSFHVVNGEFTNDFPQVFWDNAQFLLRDRIHRIQSKDLLYHIDIPFIERFEGNDAVIGFRTRFSITPDRTYITLKDYKKIRVKDIELALRLGAKAHEKARESSRALPADQN